MIHHGLDSMEVAEHLGFVVKFEMHDGSLVEGRVEAIDHEHVYLLRTQHRTLALHDIKQIVSSEHP